MTKVAPPGES